MAPHMEALVRQLDAYRDGWRAASAGAFQAWELRLQLRLALDLWQLITSAVGRRMHDARDDHGDLRDAALRDQQRLYSAWFEPARELLPVLRERNASGEFFERLAEFEHLCHEVESFLRFDVERTIQGMRDIEAGRGIPIAELRDELRRRPRPAVR